MLKFPSDSDGYCEAVLGLKSETLLSLIRIKLLKSPTAGFVLQEKHTFKIQMLSLICAPVGALGLIQRSLNSVEDFLQWV